MQKPDTPKRSLWERITGTNKPVPQVPFEEQYENPAKLRIGGVISLNTIDYNNLVFIVQDLWNWTRVINGKNRAFTDYRVRAVSHDSRDDVELLIRIIPRENPEHNFTHHFVILKKFFECGWQDEAERVGILEAVNDPNGELVWQRDTPEEARFWRINTKNAYECSVDIVLESEIDHQQYKLWDFHRETKDEANQPLIEYLFVHQNMGSGDFEAWRGEEVDPSRIHA